MKRTINRPAWLTVFPGLALIVVLGFSFFTHESLLPGPTSGRNDSGEPLGGYISHADFEMGCGHCHAPIHCISDTHCQDCHIDVAEQRATLEGIHGRLPGTSRCQNCHIEHKGRDVDIAVLAFQNVDHYKLSGFSLDLHLVDYDQAELDCQSCHTQDKYADSTLDCLTCHVEADHDAMAKHVDAYGVDCISCHDGLDRMNGFTHDQTYVLEGAHAQAACLDCHVDYKFAGTTQNCSDCHEDPELHAEQFGLDCARCHGAAAWAPAQLKEHVFLFEMHDEGNPIECQDCHIESYAGNTCTDCHDEQDPMHTAHQENGVDESRVCAECHPTGLPDEALQIMQQENANP